MAYSRKGWWLAVGASLLVLGFWVITVRLGHWTMIARGVSGILVAVVAGALAIRAFFFQDEIQKLARMRDWYFGSLTGFLAAGILMVCIRMDPQPLLSWLHSAQIHLVSTDQSLVIGLGMGFVATGVLQLTGLLVARAITLLRTGT